MKGLGKLAAVASLLGVLALPGDSGEKRVQVDQGVSHLASGPKKPGDLSLKEIIEGIDCSHQFTLNGDTPITDHELLEVLKCGAIQKVDFQVASDRMGITVTLDDGSEVESEILVSFGQDLQKYLLSRGIDATVGGSSGWPSMGTLLFLLSLLTIGGIEVAKILWSRKKYLPLEDLPKVRFDDIGGLGHVKADLMRLVDEISRRDEIGRLGGRIPKGVLFSGPSGSGKTLSAEAVAGEAGVPFIRIAASDMISKWVGDTQKGIRDLFARARKVAKRSGACIIFIDEFEALGASRSPDDGSAAGKEQNSIVNQLLVELGSDRSLGVIVIAATNFEGALDGAVTRPGRFDRKVHFHLPDQAGRLEILRILTRKIDLAGDVRLEVLASTLVGSSGADLDGIIQDAIRTASARRESPFQLTQADLMNALDRAVMGLETDINLSDDEKQIVATHEAGHTIMALMNPGTEVERVSVIPRGNALGITMTPPMEESHNPTKSQLLWRVKMLLGGILAERLTYRENGMGASEDIKRATGLVRDMVEKWGMQPEGADGLCNVRCYGLDDTSTYREAPSENVELAINVTLEGCKAEVLGALTKHAVVLREIAELLVKNGTIGREELLELWRKHSD